MQYNIEIEGQHFVLNGSEMNQLNAKSISPNHLHIISENKNFDVTLEDICLVERTVTVVVNGSTFHLSIKDEYDDLLHEMGMDIISDDRTTDVKAPMPGLILEVMVKVGQSIEKGDQLVILEAMKMENVLQAESDGVVKSVEVSKGDTVEKTQLLIELE